MKHRINSFLALTFFGFASLFIVSCEGTDDETPAAGVPNLTITTSGSANVSGQTISAVPGDSIIVNWNATTPGGFNVFRARKDNVTIFEASRNDLGIAAGSESVQGVPFSINVAMEDLGGFDLDFIVVDDLDQQNTVTYEVNVTSPNARVYTTVLLYAPLANLSAASFFSTNTGENYSPQDVTSTSDNVSTNIDFGYYYGATNGPSLASPMAYAALTNVAFTAQVANWSTLNNTSFRNTSLSASAFNELSTWADIETAFNAGTNPRGLATSLTTGQVLAFETDGNKAGGSKKGLLVVKGITGTDGQNDRIELEVIVQESAN